MGVVESVVTGVGAVTYRAPTTDVERNAASRRVADPKARVA